MGRNKPHLQNSPTSKYKATNSIFNFLLSLQERFSNKIISIPAFLLFVSLVFITSSSGIEQQPWPMSFQNMRNTSTTLETGPVALNNKTSFTFQTSETGFQSSLLIGSNNTLYTMDGWPTFDLYSIDGNGMVKWKHRIGSPGALAEDGTLYTTSGGILIAIDSNGNEKWRYSAPYKIKPPSIGLDGTIYFINGYSTVTPNDYELFALNSDGTLKWRYMINKMFREYDQSHAIATDGSIYVITFGGSTGYDIWADFLLINPNGTLSWEKRITGLCGITPSIGTDGTIYGAGYHGLIAFNQDGTEKWRTYVSSSSCVSTPLIGPDGTVYVNFSGTKLTAFSQSGNIKWTKNISVSAIGIDGILYGHNGSNFASFDKDGNILSTGPLKTDNSVIRIGSNHSLFIVLKNTKNILKFSDSGGFIIYGTVNLNGFGLQNVAIESSSRFAYTASDGQYNFPGLANGSYTITPSLTGYSFNPPSRQVTISGSSVASQDFRACVTSVPLSGTLRDATTNSPLSGVTVTADGTSSDVTDMNGYYEISGLSCGDHTITVNVPSGYSSYTRTMDTSLNTTWNINLTNPATVYGPQTPSGYSKDPVNTATGNYIYQKQDLMIPGIGMPFIFERNYNSQDAIDGPLGFGWGHTYNAGLTVNPNSSVTIRMGDGKTETWTPDGVGGYTPQYGVFDTLINNGNGTYALKKKDLTKYNFDTSNRLASIVDKNGNIISLTYTGGNLTQITDTSARNINFSYDGSNRVTIITDPIGRTLQYSYDANGDLVTATDMNGNVTTYTYDSNHQLLTLADPRGNTVVTNVYDALKRVVNSQSDAKGGATTYTYDEVNKKTTIVDQEGYTTIHYHDELLRLIQETDGSGNSAYYTYDAGGNRTQIKDKNGNVTNYTYDAKGNVLTKTDALNKVTTVTYDSNNNPLTKTDAIGNLTTFEYDVNSNLTKTTDALGHFTTITYNATGLPLTITDARGGITTNTYDTEGNLLTVTDALGSTTTYTYDGGGRRLTAKDALNHTTTYTYDSNNNLLSVTDPMSNVSTFTYDGNNNKLTVTDPNGNTTAYTYDVKDLLIIITDPLLNTVTNTYDGLDRKLSILDKRVNATSFTYDAFGNVLSVTDPMTKVTSFTYDANGNRLTETNPLSQTITYTYDTLNRIVIVTDNLSNATNTAYDALGRVISMTNAKSQTTIFNYDALSRLTQVTDANGGIVIYTYDENGNRLTMTEPNGNTTSYAYDALNRLVQKVEPLANTYQYTYDAIGNRISLKDAKGITINYTYDANNRLSVITYPDTSTVTFSYDADGNRIQMVDSLGTSTYSYDALNRMVSHTDPFGKTIGYGYDANGNRTLLTYPGSKAVNYSYDTLNRLSSVTDWLTNTTAYAYDAAGKLTTATNPNSTTANYSYDVAGRLTGLLNKYSDTSVISNYTYSLDAIGNHTSAVKDEPLLPILANKNITYTYDAENRLINEGGTAQFYDANGNLTAKGSDNFVYDYEDRLTQSDIGGVLTQYGYNGLGNRLLKTEGSATTKYVLDINRKLSNVIAETDDAGTITAYYVYGLGLISKVLPNGTAYYYHYDSRGSTIALSDAAENLTDTYAYGTFGNLANSQGSTVNQFKYVGKYGVMDEGNGLNYIRARYYSPDIGRFITKDPQTGNDSDGQSLNRYIYALNNPVTLIDISGFSAQEGRLSQDYNGCSDANNAHLVDVNKKKIQQLLRKNQMKLNEEELRIILHDIRLEKWLNIAEGLEKAGKSASGAIKGLFTGNWSSFARGITEQGLQIINVSGKEDMPTNVYELPGYAMGSQNIQQGGKWIDRALSLIDFGENIAVLKDNIGELNNISDYSKTVAPGFYSDFLTRDIVHQGTESLQSFFSIFD